MVTKAEAIDHVETLVDKVRQMTEVEFQVQSDGTIHTFVMIRDGKEDGRWGPFDTYDEAVRRAETAAEIARAMSRPH